ncbi:hypothetical protein U6A24_12635 [Aquimarina gracilis]|uniref:Uncharacterized protein n=1 Tax=Aquimarina gracilis TaxID=874422 RepID=A0ABU5ZWR6_9FLAO|nr:hypothetical protein [Aquimarina gracilis]MEB3346316.1 hypothetical protein [Aquimarina gracilis]
MNAEFNNIIHRLKTNNKICVEIKDYTTGDAIVPITDRLDGTKMIETSGGIEEWFTALQEKGADKIQIQLHRKQGNACVREGIAYNFELGKPVSDNEPKKNEVPMIQQAQGLAMPGLGMPEMINLHVDRSMLALTKNDLQAEKQKTERLEKENRELEEKLRQLEKSSDIKEFWSGLIKETAPALTGIFTTMKGPGLAAPATSNDSFVLPEGLKGQLIKVIVDAQGVTDQQLLSAYYVLQGYGNKNEEFINDLQQLFYKHNFISNGKDNNDTGE